MFLASNIAGPVGGTIGSVLVLIIVSIVCSITVVALVKKGRKQNSRINNTEPIELQTVRSPETMPQRGPSRPLPNTTLNTIPQRQNQYPGYETESTHYPEANHRPPPPYNEISNTFGPHEAPAAVSYPYLGPYQQQAGHHLTQQPPSSDSPQPSAPPCPYEIHAFNTLEMNQGRQPNTSAALTSFATFPAHNPIVQASRQQGSNTSNWEASPDVQRTLDNPLHGRPDYDNVETLRMPPPPSYTDLFKN